MLPLFADLGLGPDVIQKHVPPCVFETVFPCHGIGLAQPGRPAVDEVQFTMVHQACHQPAHAGGVLGQAAAHVIVHAADIRHRIQRLVK